MRQLLPLHMANLSTGESRHSLPSRYLNRHPKAAHRESQLFRWEFIQRPGTWSHFQPHSLGMAILRAGSFAGWARLGPTPSAKGGLKGGLKGGGGVRRRSEGSRGDLRGGLRGALKGGLKGGLRGA